MITKALGMLAVVTISAAGLTLPEAAAEPEGPAGEAPVPETATALPAAEPDNHRPE